LPEKKYQNLSATLKLSHSFEVGKKLYIRKGFINLSLYFWSHRNTSNAATGYPWWTEVFCPGCS